MPPRIIRVETLALYAPFAAAGAPAPEWMTRPAAHFTRIARTGQHSTMVRVVADDGATGVGEGFGLPTARASAAMIDEVIAPYLIGQAMAEPAAMLRDMTAYMLALGQTAGPAWEALSAVNIALWDLTARRAGRPLHAMLGAEARAVPAYASPVPFLPTPDESAGVARGIVARGFDGVKLKVGRGIAVDLPHLEAVRGAIGAARLMLDANCAFGFDDALAFAREAARFEPAWLEEPLAQGDADALAQLRRRVAMPLAAGENEFNPAAYERLARLGAVDFIQPNISRAGGIDGVCAIGALCQRHGLAMALHGVGGGITIAASVHAACATPTAWIEANLLPNPFRDDLPAAPTAPAKGAFSPRAAPGHGCDIDWTRASTFTARPHA